MEWSRVELKTNAKAWLRRCYWKAFLVCLIVTIVTGVGTGARGESADNNESVIFHDYGESDNYRDITSGIVNRIKNGNYGVSINLFRDGITLGNFIRFQLSTIAIFIMILVGIATLLLSIFIFDLFTIGRSRFLLSSRVQDTGVGEILFPFKSGYYLQTVAILFFRNLFTALWSLLFVIPGIVKAYEYRMIPYLLAEFPNMTREDAFRYTKDMMYGEKWNAFVLDLSFLGWRILGSIMCGIGGIFFDPYIEATNVELYLVLKHKVNL